MVLRSSIHLAGWILAVSTAGLGGCSQPRTAESRAPVPELRLEGVRFRLFRDDALRAAGTASTVTYRRESTEVKAADLSITLRERRDEVTLTAPAGEGIVSARTFEATGGVRAVRGDDTATTEAVRFDPDAGPRGRVVGDRPVELAGKGYRMRGNGLTLDPAEGQIVLRGGTRLVAGVGGPR
jgi:hypothetical protein